MKKVRVIWSDEALYDLDIVYDFIAKKSSKAAIKIVGQILSRTKQLESFPQSGQQEETLKKATKSYRYLVEGNYKIIYSIDDSTVYVETVFDARQDPTLLK